MSLRTAAVAGQFYDASAQQCREHIENLLPQEDFRAALPEKIIAAVVPHAGWAYSGQVAARVFAALKAVEEVETFVIFGAVHAVRASNGLLYDRGSWQTPLGEIDIDEPLAAEILAVAGPAIEADTGSHTREHSIEVQVPIIQHLFEQAKIVPIMIPPTAGAQQAGAAAAQAIAASNAKIICIASTDLTHYGPNYGYTPMGAGPEALAWAKDTNDRYFIDLALSMQADQLVETAQLYHNACGAGAVAATIAAAKQLGAAGGTLLAHTTSAEVVAEKYHQSSEDSVGYAGIIFS